MRRSRRLTLSATLLGAAAIALSACGSQGIEVSQEYREGAELFASHCSACHTLEQAGTEGSATNVATREAKDGPNFDQRPESVDAVLYAIQNGGFSSGPMPQNIVTGEEAQKVAEFVAEYAGKEAVRPVNPQGSNPQTPPGAESPDTQ
jgi:mono/diheme cytochrome c family protein